jgi:predicted transcriptional regulator
MSKISTASRSAKKVAITLRLDPERVRQLQASADAENRSLTNYVETALIRTLAQTDEASRVITMYVAPGTADQIDPAEILRGEGETDLAYAKRQALIMELWSIPDSE